MDKAHIEDIKLEVHRYMEDTIDCSREIKNKIQRLLEEPDDPDFGPMIKESEFEYVAVALILEAYLFLSDNTKSSDGAIDFIVDVAANFEQTISIILDEEWKERDGWKR